MDSVTNNIVAAFIVESRKSFCAGIGRASPRITQRQQVAFSQVGCCQVLQPFNGLAYIQPCQQAVNLLHLHALPGAPTT
ncbi:hypothetical protein D3C78_1477130 [compost metagenome]